MDRGGWGILAGLAAGAALLLTFVYLEVDQEHKPPDYEAMRKYRVSRLTDEQLRDMHAAAERQHSNLLAEAQGQEQAAWARISEQVAQCKDPAYRARNNCSGTASYIPEDVPGVEAIFESKIVGSCEYVQTVRDARKRGCLPPLP